MQLSINMMLKSRKQISGLGAYTYKSIALSQIWLNEQTGQDNFTLRTVNRELADPKHGADRIARSITVAR
jgi:hypothetical protein